MWGWYLVAGVFAYMAYQNTQMPDNQKAATGQRKPRGFHGPLYTTRPLGDLSQEAIIQWTDKGNYIEVTLADGHLINTQKDAWALYTNVHPEVTPRQAQPALVAGAQPTL